MDVITHTIVAMISLLAAYYVGYRRGERYGAQVGMAAVIGWIQEKIGMVEWRVWEKELEEAAANDAADE